MSAFSGSKITRDLCPPSEELPIAVEALSRKIDRKARVDSPYFKSHNSGVSVQQGITQSAKAVSTRIVHEAQSSTPRLHSRDASVSPPRLKRSGGSAAKAIAVADGSLPFEDPKSVLRSPSLQAFQLLTKDAYRARGTELLHVSNPNLRRGPSDDNSSIYSGETRLSESTSSERRKTTCYYCKSPGHANMPLTLKCSIPTCPNEFHDCDKCLNATVCEVKGTHETESGRIIRCDQCIKEGKSDHTKPLPLAAAGSTLLLMSSEFAPSRDAITKSSVASTLKPNQHSPVKANNEAQRQNLHNNIEDVHGDVSQETFAEQRPSSLTSSNTLRNNDHIPKHDSIYGRSVDMSNVPKGPAAMRNVSSPTMHRTPHTNSLLDSYRPDPPAIVMDSRGTDSYKPLERPRQPPVYFEKEREKFLRRAPKSERDQYLEQNRTSICKEITCPHWFVKNDCKYDDKCMYAHVDTGSYWPSPNQPSKKWTCYFWKFSQQGCLDREDDCLFAHYDTGIYTDCRGTASMKHVECFWWSKSGHCKKGEDCWYAHRYTGKVAEDPRLPRHRTSLEQNPRSNGPQSPVRRLSDFRQHQSSMNRSSPPRVRDTPLSPIDPSDSESEEYEPPSVKASPSNDRNSESNGTSTHLLPPQSIVEPLPAILFRNTTTVADIGELTAGEDLGKSIPVVALEDSKQNVTPQEATPDASTSVTAPPKQYARRTGGVKLNRPGDPRRKRLELTSLGPSHQSKDVKCGSGKSSTQMPATNPNTNYLSVGSSSGRPKCQICQRYVLVNQAANHKCQPTLIDRASLSKYGLNDQVNSQEPILIDDSPRSHSPVNSLSASNDIRQQTQPNVTIGSEEMAHMFLMTPTESTLPIPTMSVPKRAAPGSEADAMFIPNKKRRMVPPLIIRTVTSTSSLGAEKSLELTSAKPESTIRTQLSISDLTELEALRKEIDVTDEEQLLDDASILEILRQSKRLKLASERKARARAEAPEKIERLRAKAAEEEAAADAAEKASREEELAEIERNRQKRKKHERLRAQARLRDEARDEDADFSEAPSALEGPPPFRQDISARTPPSAVRGVKTSSLIQNGVVTSSRQNSVECEEEQAVRKRDKPAPEGTSSPTAPVVPLQANDPVVKDGSELKYASSDEDVEHDEPRNGNAPKSFSFFGPKRVACEPCRRRRIQCRHYSRSIGGVAPQQHTRQMESRFCLIVPTQPHIDGDRSSSAGTDSVDSGFDGQDVLEHKPRLRACVSCHSAKRKCYHDPVTGQPDPVRWERAQRAGPERQTTTPDLSPWTSTTPHPPAREQMLLSINASISATKTATSALTRIPSSAAQEAPRRLPDASIGWVDDDTIHQNSVSEPLNAVPGITAIHPAARPPENGNAGVTGSPSGSLNQPASLNTDLNPRNRDDDHTTTHPSTNSIVRQVEDDGYPQCNNCPNTTRKRIRRWNGTDHRLCDPCYMYRYYHGVDKPIQRQETVLSCGNCGLLPPNRLRRRTIKDHLLCNRCYRYRSASDKDRPLDHHETSEDEATDGPLADDSNSLGTNIKLGAGFTYSLAAKNKCLTAQCNYCTFKHAQNSTLEKQHRRECSEARPCKKVVSTAPNSARDHSLGQGYHERLGTNQQKHAAREASDIPSIAAEVISAKALASAAVLSRTALTPTCIAPDEIQALFCQPPLKLVAADGDMDDVPLSLNDQDADCNSVRLVKAKVLSKEEKASEIASMRADGIEVISVVSDSDNPWDDEEEEDDDDDDEAVAASWPSQPVTLVQNSRYEQEPDPRRWVDKAEDLKSSTFDPSAVKEKIEARLGLKANVKARRNGKKPGKLLAMSDWRGRIRKYGSVHREIERDPGPQKKGTFIRDVADRTLVTLPRGFDDETIQRETVEGTMREFLGFVPGQMRYDLIGAARLVQARTLAFSDATGRRVSDKEKFPVGMGG